MHRACANEILQPKYIARLFTMRKKDIILECFVDHCLFHCPLFRFVIVNGNTDYKLIIKLKKKWSDSFSLKKTTYCHKSEWKHRLIWHIFTNLQVLRNTSDPTLNMYYQCCKDDTSPPLQRQQLMRFLITKCVVSH